MADTFMNEIIPHGVLWALLCPFAGLPRHRWLTVRVFIGEIPVPVVERKGNDLLMESATHFPLRNNCQGFRELLKETRTLFQYQPLVQNLGILVLERVGRLPSEYPFFHSHL
jgi:hypothetical protein